MKNTHIFIIFNFILKYIYTYIKYKKLNFDKKYCNKTGHAT